MTDLTVIIPAYREGENLKEILPGLLAMLEMSDCQWEVLIVDTEDPLDDTEVVCRSFDNSRLRHLRRSSGPSFGSAVRTGIAASSGRYLVFMDGDGSHDPAFVLKLFEQRDNADVVVASRYIAGGGTENSFVLKLMSYAVNLAFRVMFSLNCKDVSNSFKLYQGEQIRALRLTSNNFDIIEEILVKLKRRKPELNILEIPFMFRNRVHGTTKRNLISFAMTFGMTLVRLRFMK